MGHFIYLNFSPDQALKFIRMNLIKIDRKIYSFVIYIYVL